MYGSLARSGKVKAQTPRVPKTSEASTKYSTNKFRSKESDRGVSVTFEKYNTAKGWEKLEFIEAKKQESIIRRRTNDQWYHRSTDTNHKKWHRNHPKDGFYQSRQVVDNL